MSARSITLAKSSVAQLLHCLSPLHPFLSPSPLSPSSPLLSHTSPLPSLHSSSSSSSLPPSLILLPLTSAPLPSSGRKCPGLLAYHIAAECCRRLKLVPLENLKDPASAEGGETRATGKRKETSYVLYALGSVFLWLNKLLADFVPTLHFPLVHMGDIGETNFLSFMLRLSPPSLTLYSVPPYYRKWVVL